MNTGFYVAKNLSKDIDCFIFHDVDVIAEDDRIIYTCRGNDLCQTNAVKILDYRIKNLLYAPLGYSMCDSEA